MMLYRSRDGARYHAATCRYAGSGVPWLWALDKTEAQILDAAIFGVLPCKTCRPVKGGTTQTGETGTKHHEDVYL